jgi:GDP-4-dehydro-6-deoxy-D-mannose reductase
VSFARNLPKRPRLVGLDISARRPDGLDVYSQVDLEDSNSVAQLAEKYRPNWVVHLAGLMPPTEPSTMWRANVGGTLGLVAGLRSGRAASARVVSVGSAAEYTPVESTLPRTESSPCGGASVYGKTKLAQSLVALGAAGEGVETLVVRAFNLLGPGSPGRHVVGWLCEQLASGPSDAEIVLGNIDSSRDFVDVRDAVEGYWLAATRGLAGEVYNLCTGAAVSVRTIVDILGRIEGRTLRVTVDPSRLRQSDPPAVWGEHSKLTEATGWIPRIPLEQSLRDMLQASRNNR